MFLLALKDLGQSVTLEESKLFVPSMNILDTFDTTECKVCAVQIEDILFLVFSTKGSDRFGKSEVERVERAQGVIFKSPGLPEHSHL